MANWIQSSLNPGNANLQYAGSTRPAPTFQSSLPQHLRNSINSVRKVPSPNLYKAIFCTVYLPHTSILSQNTNKSKHGGENNKCTATLPGSSMLYLINKAKDFLTAKSEEGKREEDREGGRKEERQGE